MGDSSSQVKPETKTPTAAALARKRRIELRKMQKTTAGDEDLDSDSCTERKRARVEEEPEVDPVTSKPKPHITGIKKQSRYDPGVSMNKDELKSWRKEARRVRNRESAAASRVRNKSRITELEEEVDALNSKYAAALQRIIELEAAASTIDSFTPAILRQDLSALATKEVSRPSSPTTELIKTVSPPASPTYSSKLIEEGYHPEQVNKKYQHIMDLISRPIACVDPLPPDSWSFS